MLACDFFHVDLVGLSRVYVFFVLQGQIRRVVLGVTRYPERDPFDAVFGSEGIQIKKSAPQCPKKDAYAERMDQDDPG